MKKFTFILIVCSTFLSTTAQNLNAYSIFNNVGESVYFNQLVEIESQNHIILFGELHDNPIAHWLQLELTIAIHKNKGGSLVLGAEMFETDNQLILNEYLQDLISQTRFESEVRLWPNYKTDYKPLVEFAKENQLNFIATNIPRRYASRVATGGFESLGELSDMAKSYIAPLPIEYDSELPGYKAMLSMMGMPGKGGPKNDNFPKAQAIKDATMAWNISRNFDADKVFIHFHGTYHSNNYEGIVWYLNQYEPDAKIITIATVLQDNTDKLDEENLGLADFIIVVPQRMTRTY
jgi:uncharacterized iron-regulated protein